MPTNHPYDLVVGLDRSDRKADLHLITTATGQRRSLTIDTSPLWEWLLELRQSYPQARVALCLEQPAVHLVAFLEAYEWITLFPINPISLQKYREAFVTSRAKDDGKDARYLAELLLNHYDKLKAWAPEDSATRAVQQLVFHRRAVVDERTGLSNRLIALLKQYFPRPWFCAGKTCGVRWPPDFAQMVQPPGGAEGQTCQPENLLLSQRLPQRQTARTTPGAGATGRSRQR